MRINRVLAVAASGAALVAAATLPAAAGPGQHAVGATKTFPSTISPKTVHTGQTLTLKGHGAKKNTAYVCLMIVDKGTTYGYDLGTLKNVKSTKTGTVTCKQKFKPYSVTVGGKKRHCPLTAADKKAKFRCAVAVATTDKSSATIGYFTGKK
jgi:hypothetical protein